MLLLDTHQQSFVGLASRYISRASPVRQKRGCVIYYCPEEILYYFIVEVTLLARLFVFLRDIR